MKRYAGLSTPSSSPKRPNAGPEDSDSRGRQSTQTHLRRFANAWECTSAELFGFFGNISTNTAKHLSPLTCYPWEQVKPILHKYRNQRLAGHTPRGSSKTKPWQPIDIENTLSQLREATEEWTPLSHCSDDSTEVPQGSTAITPTPLLLPDSTRCSIGLTGSPIVGGTRANPLVVENPRTQGDHRTSSLISISPSSLDRLNNPKACLNDEVINGILKLITSASGGQLLAIDSLATRSSLGNLNARKTLIPIHIDHHWILAVAERRRFTVYDSYPTAGIGFRAEKKLGDLFQTRLKDLGWRFVVSAPMMQDNDHDCGVFLLAAACCEAINMPVPNELETARWRSLFRRLLEPLTASEVRNLDQGQPTSIPTSKYLSEMPSTRLRRIQELISDMALKAFSFADLAQAWDTIKVEVSEVRDEVDLARPAVKFVASLTRQCRSLLSGSLEHPNSDGVREVLARLARPEILADMPCLSARQEDWIEAIAAKQDKMAELFFRATQDFLQGMHVIADELSGSANRSEESNKLDPGEHDHIVNALDSDSGLKAPSVEQGMLFEGEQRLAGRNTPIGRLVFY